MKKKVKAILPFVISPVFLPVYRILDGFLLVDIFGCGCVPEAQTNMLNIPFNANDLRVVVFALLAAALFAWSIPISKAFQRKPVRILYCTCVLLANAAFALWAARAYMWA